jgi:ATP-dependent RNA helicase DeaD
METNTQPSFSSFGLTEAMLDALKRKGFTAPTSIQEIALPRLLADEGHLIVKARTGTGKTAAFGIPLVERLSVSGPTHAPRALILTPTRELALQISREIASLCSGPYPRIAAIYGGASIRNQILDLKRGAEIAVGTPGRVMDMMKRKILDLSAVDWFILDEADEMLDMGFLEDVETIMAQVKSDRRVALFSATMPEPILRIIRDHIGRAEILEDAAPEDEKPLVDQFYLVLKKEDRLEALRRIIDQADDFYGLVFCATKAGVDELARRLMEGGYACEAIHGDLSQEARERTLRRFRSRQTSILVATDVAARGLDIEKLTHVINWDLPNDRETYVHRIGRTGRAGRRGRAVSLALPGERGRMSQLSRSMERVLGSRIECTKAPSVKTVMKAVKARIIDTIMEAAGENAGLDAGDFEAGGAERTAPETADSAFTRLARELIEKIGAEKTAAALLSLSYGEQLDSSRYGTITDIPDLPPVLGRAAKGPGKFPGKGPGKIPYKKGGQSRHVYHAVEADGPKRVYVGLGTKHGASARDIARLLMRAGGVPGRMVDAIEMKEFCAFATMPAAAVIRACAFSRNTPGDPPIRPASQR